MFTISNRLRGTYGWFAKIFATTIFLVSYYITGSILISLLFGVGYWVGELLCGWGDHVGNTTCERYKVFPSFPEDGSEVGVRWLTSFIMYPKLYRLHFANAKIGFYNLYAKTVNFSIKGYSVSSLLKLDVHKKDIHTFIIDNALWYSRVFLVIRGFFWWIFPMVGVSLLFHSILYGALGLFVLSVGFPICAELGYIFRDKISISKFGLSFIGGWELQEGFYGILQDLVFLGLVLSY